MLIVGNWKMHGLQQESRNIFMPLKERLTGYESSADVVICPPFTALSLIAELLRGCGSVSLSLGAQDCHMEESGSHTGDISAVMLRDIGCDYVILGHSERRTNHGETSKLVSRKAQAAHKAGLKVIICVGETFTQRKTGVTLDVIAEQVEESLPDSVDSNNTVIAYEPVWAIGSGEVPTSVEIAEVHDAILRHPRCRSLSKGSGDKITGNFGDCIISQVLYGGSVKPANAKEILSIDGVAGALVGGASLDAESFFSIIQAAG